MTEQTNRERFRSALEAAFTDLYANDEHYRVAALKYTPSESADRMVDELIRGTAFVSGIGVRRACAEVGIKPTSKAIKEFLL